MLKKLLFIFPLVISTNVFSQDEAVDSDVEEVVTVGSQIKGAKISGALPVSILTSDDIDALGVEDGTELLENIAEQSFYDEEDDDSDNNYTTVQDHHNTMANYGDHVKGFFDEEALG